MKKIQIGQTLYSRYMYRNNTTEIRERVVTKVGNKYFYCDNDNRCKYSIETLTYDSGYNSGIKLYTSKQEIFDNDEMATLRNKLRAHFDWTNNKKNTLGELREAAKILKVEEVNK